MPGSAVVMHLVMREQLPEPANQGKLLTQPIGFLVLFCFVLVVVVVGIEFTTVQVTTH